MTADHLPEYSVSELSGQLKRTIEDAYGYVRVRGELGRVTRAGSGHVYLDLKDERSVLSSVMWKGTASRQTVKPEQGLEVIATGRMSTFPGQSRYQLIIDTLAPAGAGALMALYEERKKKLAAEGLFAPERKRPLPRLPGIIGVVTSPSGAVIRDILHRLRDRFPSHVIVWPSVVQGEGAPAQIVRGIKGLADLPNVQRPDVIIVARGGGSLEDLWCFNDEDVVRAAAASPIPLISAVGHETDTTLIDYAADLRAPTPTAAAELVVPVRAELLADVRNYEGRLVRQLSAQLGDARLRLQSAERGLGTPQGLLESSEQRLDRAESDLQSSALQALARQELRLGWVAPRLTPALLRGESLRRQERFDDLNNRLGRAGEGLTQRFEQRLSQADRLLRSVSYRGVLERGFALVADREGSLITSVSAGEAASDLTITFADGDLHALPKHGSKAPIRKTKSKPNLKTSQAGLFER
ncbi:MAG: exodeoxyribonuclease VII large subunit [Pseudomonadota bacterium]